MSYKRLLLLLSACSCLLIGSAQSSFLVPYRLKKQWGFSDYSGKISVVPQYDTVGLFESYGNVSVALVEKGNKHGVLSDDGKILLPLVYESIEIIYSNKTLFFKVRQNKKYGLLSYPNKTIVLPQYDRIDVNSDYAYPISHNKMYAQKGKQYFKLSSTGVATKINEFDYMNEDLQVAVGYSEEKPRAPIDAKIIAENNSQLIDSIDSRPVRAWKPWVYKIFKNGKIGFVAEYQIEAFKIKEHISPVYDTVLEIRNGENVSQIFFLVSRDSLVTIINVSGKMMMPLKYASVADWNYKWAYLKRNNKVGFYLFNEQIEIEPRYDYMEYHPSVYHLWYVRDGRRAGFINKDGFEYFRD